MENKIHVTEIPENVAILEQCEAFPFLLRHFKRKTGAIMDISDFFEDLHKVEAFDNFILTESLANTLPITIDEKLIPRTLELVEDFKRRYGYCVRNADKLYVEIRHKLYGGLSGEESTDLQVKKDMRLFLAAYHMVKSVFENQFRTGILPGEEKPERYFNHLAGTMGIVLNELPNPNINTVVMALLHDSIEDIKGINFQTLCSIFGDYIAGGVEVLSKKELAARYLSQYENEMISRLGDDHPDTAIMIERAKQLRQEEYFGHLDDLDDDYLTVKFADRIHNLRTLGTMPLPDIIKKIEETEKYFLPVAERRNPQAYTLIQAEIEKLQIQLKTTTIE